MSAPIRRPGAGSTDDLRARSGPRLTVRCPTRGGFEMDPGADLGDPEATYRGS